ncbi:MAG: right-handed parallel beta-helix repeat-containing protein [Thermanaerothrix sp.]|nr:right-handed parallel beta-helix repeat-containing protein [Thermanaerothrix sp.]
MSLKNRKLKRLRRMYLVLATLLVGCSVFTPEIVGKTQAQLPVPQVTEGPAPQPSEVLTVSASLTPAPDTSFDASATARVFLPLITRAPTLPPIGGGRSFFAAPNGTTSGDGSMDRPFNLAYAIEDKAKTGFFQPGDVIWVRGGTYGGGGLTYFNSHLQGTVDRPIVVRAYPGEHPIINGSIKIYKPNVIFWGLAVINTDPNRTSQFSGSFPDDIYREDAFSVYATNVKIINNIMHDAAEGVYADDRAPDVVIYGNLIYNNGWKGPDRGHGHGIYAQNQQGSKWIEDNIIFNNFSGYSLHVYRENEFPLVNFNFDGNVTFNGTFLVGGRQPTRNVILTNQFTYNETVALGFSEETQNQNVRVQNGYLYNRGDYALEVKAWQGVTLDHNFLGGQNAPVVNLFRSSGAWNYNQYVFASNGTPFLIDGRGRTWDQWRSQTGFDSDSSFITALPSATQVFIRSNRYEAKRGHVIVYNWAKQGQVLVDLKVLGYQPGDRYEIHNAQNFEEKISGIYQGEAVTLPLNNWSVAKPVGWPEPLRPVTLPEFGVFIVLSP